MHTNSRFIVAIMALVLAKVAQQSDESEAVTSERMAECAATHPVVIRRIFASLREARLVRSQSCPGGGWRLSRPASEITLRDVYQAINKESVFGVPRPDGVIGKESCQLPTILVSCFRAAEDALAAQLARVTIAEVIESAMPEIDIVTLRDRVSSVVGTAATSLGM